MSDPTTALPQAAPGLTDYARSLNASGLYALAAALRGPDVYQGPFEGLKHAVTARLRHIAFGEDLDVAYRNSETLTDDDVRRVEDLSTKAATENPGAYSHFRSHLVDAIRVTRDHPIWGGRTRATMLSAALHYV